MNVHGHASLRILVGFTAFRCSGWVILHHPAILGRHLVRAELAADNPAARAHAGPSQIAEAHERGLLSDSDEGCRRDELLAPLSPILTCTFATPPENDGAPSAWTACCPDTSHLRSQSHSITSSS